jgi:beta-glucosidase-like glycosyl hydrolase
MYRMDIIPHGLMKALSSNIDDRTLHELYSWPFAEGIRAGVGAVMTAYVSSIGLSLFSVFSRSQALKTCLLRNT